MVRLAVFQPTSFCNLDCRYCYVPNRQDAARMSREVMVDAFHRFAESPLVGPELEILWHAGEPLAVGMQFYQDALDLQKDMFGDRVRIINNIQTNGTLLDPEWCAFFSKNGIKVSVSLDGPPQLHDQTRRFRSGRGSFEKVMGGISRLREHGIDFGILAVLTKLHLQQPDALYEFYRDNGFAWVGFNVEEREGENTGGLHPGDDGDDYQAFFSRFLERWTADGSPFVVREFQSFHATIMRVARDAEYFRQPDETIPLAIVTIGRGGEIHTYSPEFASTRAERYGDFVFGNVATDAIDETLLSRRPDIVREVRQGIDACRAGCEYFRFCGGAYVSNRATEHGDLRVPQTAACTLHRQLLLEVVLAGLEQSQRSLQVQ